jgi:hypothetical protein
LNRRLAASIEPNGSQPEELKRTRSLHYSLFGLAAVAYTARMGESLGLDLWTHEAGGRGSIEEGLVFVAPYVLDQKTWPHEQIEPYRLTPQVVNLFRLALPYYRQPILKRVYAAGPRSQSEREFAALELP